MCPRFAAAIAVVALVSSCGDGAEPERILVSASASLTDAFSDMEAAFEDANPGIEVTMNFAGTPTLRQQILGGAPVDVFASADMASMSAVAEVGAAREPRVFAGNTLEIAVPEGNPGSVDGLGDFDRPELFIGLCAAGVPCGDLARQVLARSGTTPSIDSNEPNVRALLTKVRAGELDAAVVYTTDIVASGDEVEGVGIPDSHNVVARYPIAVLRNAPSPGSAGAFVAFVLSDEGQAILATHGFSAP